MLRSPAAERNKQPIAEVLARVLPSSGIVLEVASGTGQHAEHFARTLPQLVWQPTEASESLVAELAMRVRLAGLPNLAEPLAFDVHESGAPVDAAAAVVCINMVHIAPWSACVALLGHCERLLESGAPLVLYGPYRRGGEHTAPSNAAFDADLRRRNPEWGVRELDEVVALSGEHAFALVEVVAMPANNLTVVLARD